MTAKTIYTKLSKFRQQPEPAVKPKKASSALVLASETGIHLLLGAVLAGAIWGLGDALDERSLPAWEAEETGDLDEKKAQTEGHPLPEGESQA